MRRLLMIASVAGVMATPFIGHVSTATATSPASKYRPKYAPTPCTDDRLPIDRTHIDCGTLTVPENRRKPNGRQVHLPVAILRSTAANKQPDPIVYLVGGPGVGGLTPATVFYDSGIVTDRDLILIDPRGTGRATPSLACTETQHVAEQSAAASESPSAAAARYERAFAQCVGRVRRSADLAQYNTPTNALDADDVRKALGIPTWNLLGISYGTQTALEMLRTHFPGVRSAVLDSVQPPDVQLNAAHSVGSLQRSLDAVASRCAADASCRRSFSSVLDDFTAAVKSLDASPHQLSWTDDQHLTRHITLTGQGLALNVANAMYDKTQIPFLPLLFHQIRSGNFAIADLVAKLPSSGELAIETAEVDTRTVRCSDHERTTRRVDLASLRRKFPWAPLLIGNRQFQDGCALLHVAPVARDYATIPATRTPTLVLAGEFDPVTPPADGKRAAKMLGEAATFVEFPTVSHAVVRTDSCARRVFQGFLANPTGKPDTSCIATIKPITWALG